MQNLLKEVSMLVLCAVTGKGWQKMRRPGHQAFPDFHDHTMAHLSETERTFSLKIQTLILGPYFPNSLG